MGIVDEFKKFALKGNVIDLAVGVIIGASFGKIVTGFTDNIIMPLVGIVMPGDASWRDWGVPLGKMIKNEKGDMVPATMKVGALLGNVLDFVIIALVLFAIIQAANKAMKKKEEVPETPAQEKLLAEIRDLLAKQKKA